MDKTDWRDELEPYSRKRSVKRIMNAMRQYHHLDDDEQHELEKFSQRLEQKTFATATSQLDYLQQITTEAVSMERKMQEELFQKIQMLKEMHLPDLNDMYQRIAYGLQELDSHPQQAESADKHEKLKILKAMLEDFIPFLQISRSKISPAFKEKLLFYEKQIINFVNKRRPWILSLPLGQVPLHAMHSLLLPPSRPTHVQSHENQINSEGQSQEAYQRIQMLKEMYLPELNEIHQRMVDKIEQLDSDPQQVGSVMCRMLKMFKAEMERSVAFLQTSRSNISPSLGEELPSHEKQIMTFIDMGRLVPASYRASVLSSSEASSSKAAQ
ncbi:mediator of RNA polymerase II transcription subunit 15a-like isoform X1 [Prosopis cineraria]|uniref:mediator of RNA polymerase II transcription subunit 15a-like isoform X1 n=1 Tax=Prosopis cineraria TaxID=364024 RepID=UPI0024106FFC|nr:mediator of RNA polymerase II transcription subunit 15a-like isoform X1 [Prosopis cineraria]XP_054780911.1 mediator of RNA polymerase II transcription subunit 15a-like isoform X1 [Prosopis cineraria]XP_054780912.1 mediator of RNA polymerase II transcription subunit 15a-like isoform X1 [Prosopis cineraria]